MQLHLLHLPVRVPSEGPRQAPSLRPFVPQGVSGPVVSRRLELLSGVQAPHHAAGNGAAERRPDGLRAAEGAA